MKLLMLRLSGLGADAENSLRVISFSDELIAQRVSMRVLAAKAARLAECPVRALDDGLGVSLRAVPLRRGRPGKLSPLSRRVHAYHHGLAEQRRLHRAEAGADQAPRPARR
jgi:hypothetical protein